MSDVRAEYGRGSAKVGVLDVGGATLEDVTAWSTWQDTAASHRWSGLPEEETHGNGRKALGEFPHNMPNRLYRHPI